MSGIFHPVMTEPVLEEMEVQLGKMRDTVRKGDTEAYYSCEFGFHGSFIDFSGKEPLAYIIEDPWWQSMRHHSS